MSDAPESRDDLTRLLSELADGTLPAANEERLAEVLRTDSAARAKYYDHVMLAALLRREGRRAAAQSQSHDLEHTRPVPLPSDCAPTHCVGAPLPATLTGRLRPWLLVLAASVLLALLLSVGEATGVTRLVPTMIRIVTGEGSLVIEVDDPAIAVTLDGADVTITGAGVHELRLRPGTHKFVATKDGQPVREEVVTIERGGQRVVKVSRQPFAASAQAELDQQPHTRLSPPPQLQPPIAASPASASARRPHVLIVLPAHDFYYPDFSPVYFPLSMYGVECSIASTTLDECRPSASSPQIPVKPSRLLASAQATDYDAIYFCGGEGIEEYCASGAAAADAKRLIDEALAARRIVAAAGMGVVILAEADALHARRVACYPYGRIPGMYARRIVARGAVCSEEGIVEDGLIVTAKAPQNVAAFGQVLLKRLGIESLPRGSPAAPAN